MMKSKGKGDKINLDEYFISIGIPETPNKGEFDPEMFPSKLGGLPIWLIPPNIDLSFFECSQCKQNLYFLMQIYSPLEELKHCYHRSIYVFFCKDCWKKTNAIKVLRIQLPEKSEFYIADKLINRETLEKNEIIQKINQKLNSIYPEYLIDSYQEISEASKIYIKFYDKLDEKSMTSGKSIDCDSDEDLEDILMPDHPSLNDEKVDQMIKNYYKDEGMAQYVSEVEEECDNEIINKLQKNIFKNAEDIFFEVFCKVTSYDPKQVVRYCRDDVFPLWFCNSGMMTMKNTKCNNCGADVIYEFQIMPHIFNLYKEIMNINIGTIVIYTCKNSCLGLGKKTSYIEEIGIIQRTGENIYEPGVKNSQSSHTNNSLNSNNIQQEQDLAHNFNKLTVKGNTNNEPDEDGFIEVKKKKKENKK